MSVAAMNGEAGYCGERAREIVLRKVGKNTVCGTRRGFCLGTRVIQCAGTAYGVHDGINVFEAAAFDGVANQLAFIGVAFAHGEDQRQGGLAFGKVITDVHPYQSLSTWDVLVKSSNIGMTMIAERMTAAKLHGALSGFGQICLRHDEPVTARLAFEYRQKRPDDEWKRRWDAAGKMTAATKILNLFPVPAAQEETE